MNENISNEELIRFLDNEELQEILGDYRKASEMAESAGFNVFQIISDYYYRENFHGDILMAFLDPKGRHGEGDKFLKIFIEMLGVDATHYGPKTTVEREVGLSGEDRGRIDFVIKNNDESNPHCIIVENKLYDAQDMPQQLIRYCEAMSKPQNVGEKGIDKIVYLPLSVDKRPEGIDKKVKEKLKIVPAVNVSDSECSLVNNWIAPCIEAASNLDCISILRQYKRLLITLKPQIITYKSSMDFIEYLLQDDRNLENAIAARKLLNNLNIHIGERLAKDLKDRGFVISGPDKDNGRKILLKNGFSLWIYCAATDNLEYLIKIVDTSNSYPSLYSDSMKWIPDRTKAKLKSGIKEETGDPYVYFQLSNEGELIEIIQEIVVAANSQNNQ